MAALGACAGVLAKLMVTPTPRAALIAGKGFAAGVRSIVQAAVIVPASGTRTSPAELMAGFALDKLPRKPSVLLEDRVTALLGGR